MKPNHALPLPASTAMISNRCARILRAHAREIQRLGRRVIGDVVEIGRRLTDAKRRLGHGKFLVWIASEFGWSERTTENFMRVYGLSCKSEKFADLDVPLSALYLLAAPSTPDAALVAVAARAGNGNGLSLAEVKDIVVNARRNSPLRYWFGVAGRILKEARDVSDVERMLAELKGDNGERVQYIAYHKCIDRIGKRTEQRDRLQEEIERLELIKNYVRPRGFMGIARGQMSDTQNRTGRDGADPPRPEANYQDQDQARFF
jgi:hypothetical protein